MAWRLQWHNWLACRTHMTETEICVGCEFEPHVQHSFINNGYISMCLHDVMDVTNGATNFQKTISRCFVFVWNVCYNSVMKQLQSFVTTILVTLQHLMKLPLLRSFSNVNGERWIFLSNILCYLFTSFIHNAAFIICIWSVCLHLLHCKIK